MIFAFYDDNDFNVNSNNLYHYTNLNSLIKILEGMTLKPSRFNKLNDLNEAKLEHLNCNLDFILHMKIKKRIDNNCFVFCFWRDNFKQKIARKASLLGINHPAMWAHYAENNIGACIVLDKKNFIAKNRGILCRNRCFYRFGDVVYNDYVDFLDEEEYNGTEIEFINKNYKKLFFTKHKDWSYENEHRLFIHSIKCAEPTDYFMDIDGCVKYIVLGNKIFNRTKSNSNKLIKLVECLLNNDNRCYNKFSRHSFAYNDYSGDGYAIFAASGMFRDNLMDNNALKHNYQKWLKT
jgi:hypothetical protein